MYNNRILSFGNNIKFREMKINEIRKLLEKFFGCIGKYIFDLRLRMSIKNKRLILS
jgi:hypothetical protein